jgi:putative transposase
VVRILDGTRVYVQTVIDNFSRRILAYRVSDRLEVANTLAILAEAVRMSAGGNKGEESTMLVADGGVENFNRSVDSFIDQGVPHRVRALADLEFSNSMIEAFWRTMTHQWLFLNTLDSVAAVRRHVMFYVQAHNNQIPRAALRRRTPDEVYFGRGMRSPPSWRRRREHHRRHGWLRIERHRAPRVRIRCHRSSDRLEALLEPEARSEILVGSASTQR